MPLRKACIARGPHNQRTAPHTPRGVGLIRKLPPLRVRFDSLSLPGLPVLVLAEEAFMRRFNIVRNHAHTHTVVTELLLLLLLLLLTLNDHAFLVNHDAI